MTENGEIDYKSNPLHSRGGSRLVPAIGDAKLSRAYPSLCRLAALAMLTAVSCSSTNDAASNKSLGTAGGHVASVSGAAIDVPAGALSGPTVLGIATATSGYDPIPGGMIARGDMFAFTPHGQQFETPVTVSVPFAGAEVVGNLQLLTASVSGTWSLVPGATVAGSVMQANVAHFSYFVVVELATTSDGGAAGACAAGAHDGGDGLCVAAGICASGYHNGGTGNCVANKSCPTDQLSDDTGTCVPMAGVNWTPRGGSGGSTLNWSAVASSADGTKFVAASYGGYLYTSTDSGATWTQRATVQNWSAVASSADGTKLVAAASGNVYASGNIYTSSGPVP